MIGLENELFELLYSLLDLPICKYFGSRYLEDYLLASAKYVRPERALPLTIPKYRAVIRPSLKVFILWIVSAGPPIRSGVAVYSR